MDSSNKQVCRVCELGYTYSAKLMKCISNGDSSCSSEPYCSSCNDTGTAGVCIECHEFNRWHLNKMENVCYLEAFMMKKIGFLTLIMIIITLI